MASSRWYSSLDGAALLFCRFTMLGFLRLLTNRHVMGDSTTTLSGALEIYDRWRQDPRVELAAEVRATEALFRQFAPFRSDPCYPLGMTTPMSNPHQAAFRDWIRPYGVLEEFACQRLATARWYCERVSAIASRHDPESPEGIRFQNMALRLGELLQPRHARTPSAPD